MKLCKDCAHAKLPNPLANFAYGHVVAFPMCAHPTATLDPIYGHTVEKCEMARMGPNCGPDAKLFEHAPTPKLFEPNSYQLIPVETPHQFTLPERFARWIWGVKN